MFRTRRGRRGGTASTGVLSSARRRSGREQEGGRADGGEKVLQADFEVVPRLRVECTWRRRVDGHLVRRHVQRRAGLAYFGLATSSASTKMQASIKIKRKYKYNYYYYYHNVYF